MKIGIVGCGLIGGSIGLACRSNGHSVLGTEVDDSAAQVATTRGCVDQIVPIEETAKAEVVFVCVPPNAIVQSSEAVLRHAGHETVVTDCGSVKAEVVAWLDRSRHTNFVPGHPMAGHEKSGPQFASGWMFRGAKWILSPAKFTSRTALKIVEAVVKDFGATPVRVDAERHDREVALLSHLPHALAAALVRLAADLESTEASAGSWKDLTRVAGVDPNLWSQILISNREEVSKALRDFSEDLQMLRQALDANFPEEVTSYLQAARGAKERSK
jgi:prephenate dehydrogenase